MLKSKYRIYDLYGRAERAEPRRRNKQSASDRGREKNAPRVAIYNIIRQMCE